MIAPLVSICVCGLNRKERRRREKNGLENQA